MTIRNEVSKDHRRTLEYLNIPPVKEIFVAVHIGGLAILGLDIAKNTEMTVYGTLQFTK
jgi:hypothetical protein